MIPAHPNLLVAITVASLLLGACDPIQEETLHAQKPPRNLAPVARMSPFNLSRIVSRFRLVLLNGSYSFDPEGESLSFAWSFRSRPAGSRTVLVDPTTALPSFTPDLAGEYVVQLVVGDGTSESAPEITTFTVFNLEPHASTDDTWLVAVTGTALTLSGLGWDEEEDPLTYTWTLIQRPTGSSAVLTGADTATPSFTPDVEGIYLLTFVVGDGQDTSSTVVVTVTAHRPPQLLGQHR